MATITQQQTSVAGFAAWVFDSGPLALTIIPALGGKISSLRDTRSGREWLWRHPRLPYAQVPPEASYVELADTGGWDECFPTVAHCHYPLPPYTGAPLPDHGALWSQATELVVMAQGDNLTLTTSWHGGLLPCTLQRTISMVAGEPQLRFDYQLVSHATTPLAWIWSAHPLLAIEPGMRLLLPAEARYTRWACLPADLVAETDLRFPQVSPALTLDPLPGPELAIALKLWSAPLAAGWARLEAADGALALQWDVAQLPQVAFWFNCGAWAVDGGTPYYNLGLEPCIGAQDSLELAVQNGLSYETLPPGGSRTWMIELSLVGAS